MSDTVFLKLSIVPSCPTKPLGFTVKLNDKVQWHSNAVVEPCDISFSIDDSDNLDYTLELILSNKLPDYTTLDSNGNIVTDSVITLKSVTMDDVDISNLISNFATYTHNFNNTGAQSDHRLYEDMGCNGVVKLRFTTPFYFWLLENMQ